MVSILAEINRAAEAILIRERGVVAALRFLTQLLAGRRLLATR